MKQKTKASFWVGISILLAPFLTSADYTKQPAIKDRIQGKRYTFVAQTMMPMRGGSRQLTTRYTLRISGDSVIADLPYAGRAYSAPMDMTGGGIQFTSTKNEYKNTPRKKGGWEITIKPGNNDTRELNLTVYSNGTAYLRVNNINRDAISFNGYISERK